MIPFQLGPRYTRSVAFASDVPTLATTKIYPQIEDLNPINMLVSDYYTTTTEESSEETTVSPYSETTEYQVTSPPDPPTATPTGRHKRKKPRPSVVPAKDFNPKKDAEKLVKALTSYGSNAETIISIMTNRTFEQRHKIAHEYISFTGIKLLDDLKREIKGKFQVLLIALFTPIRRIYLNELRKSMKGIGTNENTLLEILITLSNQEMREIRKDYMKYFHRELEGDIRLDTSGSFKKLLLTLTQGKRSESTDVNRVRAKHVAKILYRAGELRFGVDTNTFIEIFCYESFPMLNEIFRHYELLTGNDIEEVIDSEFSFDMEKGLRAIAKVARSRQLFYAENLFRAMKGFGTDDGTLIRIMVSRAEIDLLDIADMFYKRYGDRLESWIADDSSDLYRRCLLALLKPKYPEHDIPPQPVVSGSILQENH